MTLALVDTHAHVDYIVREGGNAKDVMAHAAEAGVKWLVNPGVTPDKFPDIMALVESFDNLYAAAAVHPTDVQDVDEDDAFLAVETMLKHPKVVAVGETGLDYYWDTTHKERQNHFFRRFLAMAQAHQLPIIVHCRDSLEDTRQAISEYPGVMGIMHCFSGDAAYAKSMIDLGFYISFAGNVTFKNAKNLHEAAEQTPLEWMLIETDSPFLSPMPYRGKPNEPARVKYVAEKIAELKGIDLETVARVTSENAQKVFQLPC